jgi:hypothetical protein
MSFTYGEQIALAITHAMRNNVEPLNKVLADLRAEGFDDYAIGEMFMDIGRIVFNENEIIDETEGELQEMKQAAIAGERDKIVAYMARFLCFDFLDQNGKCEDQACYQVADLMTRITEKRHLA